MQGALDAELGALARLALSSADRCLQLDDRNLDGRLAQMVVPSHFRIWQDRKDRLKPFADQYPRHWPAIPARAELFKAWYPLDTPRKGRVS